MSRRTPGKQRLTSVLLGGLAPALIFVQYQRVVFAAPGEKIDTDGPDFVESAEVVGKGRFQFETGPDIQRDFRNGADERMATAPLLLKFGVSGSVEARLETDSVTRVSGQGPSGSNASESGFADTAVGLKWHFQDADVASGAPAVAWLLHFELPTGTPDLRGHGVRPSLRSVISWDLPHAFTLGMMPGIELDSRPDGHRYESGILGIVLGRWWTDRFRAFIEASAPQIASAENGGVILYKDIGAAYLITNTWQLGGRAGWAANNNTPSRYYLLSLAARFF